MTDKRTRGPFLEYACQRCGTLVKESAPFNAERLNNRMADLNNGVCLRICAPCYQPD